MHDAHNLVLPLTSLPTTDLQELGCPLLGLASDLSDHDDPLGVGVVEEHVEAVQEVGAVERVATDADAQGLTQADLKIDEII